MASIPMGADPGEDWKTWIVPPNKNTQNIFYIYILDSHLIRNDWNGGTDNVWQIYF